MPSASKEPKFYISVQVVFNLRSPRNVVPVLTMTVWCSPELNNFSFFEQWKGYHKTYNERG